MDVNRTLLVHQHLEEASFVPKQNRRQSTQQIPSLISPYPRELAGQIHDCHCHQISDQTQRQLGAEEHQLLAVSFYEKERTEADYVIDDRPRKTQNDPAIGGPSLENPKTVAGSQSGKPPRSPRIIDMTPIFNTLGEMQKDWPHGDRSSPPSEGHKQVFPDPILPQKGPPDIGAKGIQTPRPKEPLERTPDGRLGAPSKPKGKPPKM